MRIVVCVAIAAALPAVAVALPAVAAQAPAQKFVPDVVVESDLVFTLELAGRTPTRGNYTSPVVAGRHLLLIDQGGAIHVWDGARAVEILGPKNTPSGLQLIGPERILNAAATSDGTRVFVMFISSSVPAGVPRRTSPRPGTDAWYVLYEFQFDGAALSAPRPITALRVRSGGHTGGGLALLPDQAILFAPGDNGDSYEDGGAYSQDPAIPLSKLIRIDPATGAVTTVAVGLRAVQRLVIYGQGADARVNFVDPGGWVAEELNSVLVSDVIGASAPPNFGWGRATDGRSREGTFFINGFGSSTGRIPPTDAGFVAPVAEFGRERAALVAGSGPVWSASWGPRITMLLGDLVSGSVMAVTKPLSDMRQSVYRVSFETTDGKTVTLKELARGDRPDPRFFNFPDGSAGVLLERTGEFWRLALR